MAQRVFDPQLVDAITARIREAVEKELNALPQPEVPERTPGALPSAARVIRQANTQGEALRGLLSGAGSLGLKAALFVVRHDQLEGWEAYGFGDSPSAGPLTRVRLPADQPGIAAVLETRNPVGVGGAHELPIPDFGQEMPPQAWLLPLHVQEKVAAVVYAEPAEDQAEPDLAGLETLAELTGLSIDRLVFSKAAKRPQAGSHAAAGPPTGPVFHPPIPVAPPISAPPPPPTAAAVPAPAAAPVTTAAPKPAPPPAPIVGASPEVQDARRYARLLIEDIVLYHPEKVDEGRAHRNLLARLNDEIARARQAYNQRVSESVRAQGDFFEEALVRVLAGGNPEALGTPEPQAP